MRWIGLFLVSFLVAAAAAVAQHSEGMTTKYIQLARAIDQDKALTKIHLENEDFLEQPLDGGGELTGYYHGGELRRIHCWLGYSFGTDEKDFYFDKGRLVYVRHTSRYFVYDDAHNVYRKDSLEAPFTGRYFFRNDTLVDYRITETGHHFESEKEDIESSVTEEAEKWRKILATKQHR